MTPFDEHVRRMLEEPSNLECRNYPLDPSTPLISMLDIPWYPPYTPDVMHYHNCMEIGVCLFGTGFVEAGGRRWAFSKGSVFLVPKGLRHARRNTGDPFTLWRYIAVDLDTLLAGCPEHCRVSIQKALHTSWAGGLYLPPSHPNAAEAISLIRTMFDLRCRYTDSVLPELEASLLLLLTQLACLREDMPVDASLVPLVSQNMEPAMIYVAAHYTEEIEVEQLARSCAMSESHFRRMFNSLVGYSPLEYVNRYRIQRALTLLRRSEDSISNIALRTGFPSIATFNRNFRRYVGQSPSEWRKTFKTAQF